MYYINIRNKGRVETVDSFEIYKEAKKMLNEYLMIFSCYISTRATKAWRDDEKRAKKIK